DIASVTQLIQQVQQMEQALQVAQQQLNQAQAAYQSVTGQQGMQSLLSGINRNYLPASYAQIATTLAGTIQLTVNSHAVLTPSQIAALSPAEQQQISSARANAALLEVATQQAYATTSSRFASVQQLIDAIGSTNDQKGILELQGRLQGELGMMQNDGTKL